MQVRAKFQCNSITPGFSEGQKNVRFHAVYENDGENASFSKATPSGNLEMLIDASTQAVDAFEIGKAYYLDITPAE